MRIFSHRLVDIDNVDKTDNAVDLHSLTPFERIVTSIRYGLRDSDFFSKRINQKREEELTMKQARLEDLKDIIYKYAYQKLVKPNEGKKIASIVISVDRSFSDIVYDVIKSKDLLSFNITVIEENKDMLLAFPRLPILLKVSKKLT